MSFLKTLLIRTGFVVAQAQCIGPSAAAQSGLQEDKGLRVWNEGGDIALHSLFNLCIKSLENGAALTKHGQGFWRSPVFAVSLQ